MKHASIGDGIVLEVVQVDPYAIFGEGYASTFIECPDDVIAGWTYDNGEFSVPPQQDPAVVLTEKKKAKDNEINQWRAKANSTTFNHAGKVVACDALSRSDIDAVAGSISLNGAFPVGFPNAWKAVDNTYIPLPDIAAFKAMYGSMTLQGTINFGHSQDLKAAVQAATTVEEVEAIVW